MHYMTAMDYLKMPNHDYFQGNNNFKPDFDFNFEPPKQEVDRDSSLSLSETLKAKAKLEGEVGKAVHRLVNEFTQKYGLAPDAININFEVVREASTRSTFNNTSYHKLKVVITDVEIPVTI